jgi:GAF domain-containing protein
MTRAGPASGGRDVERLRHQLGELVSMSRALSSERDVRKLLELIPSRTRQVTGADAGTVYVVEGDDTTFLRRIPWGRTLARVLEIAAPHRESMNGAGYASRLGAGEIPLETRIMTIADIFDALTAADRPYKEAVPPDKALAIRDAEVKARKCGPHLFELVGGAAIYKRGV